MISLCITFIGLPLILFSASISVQCDVEVQLIGKRYVEKGSWVTFGCEHNVRAEIIYKVSFYKGHNKLFEYIKDRRPPFRNFTIEGGEIDWTNSAIGKLTLKNIDFDAAGLYYCEVSTESPIFSKASADEQLHVILPQTGPPKISFSKRQFTIGEKLIANCTTSKARPSPHITWLINGKKVDERYVRALHPYATAGTKNGHRSKTHLTNNNNNNNNNIYGDRPQQDLNAASDGHHKLFGSGGQSREDLAGASNYGFEYYGTHHSVSTSAGQSSYDNLHETSGDRQSSPELYDNKYFETRKHRTSMDHHKNRRHINDERITLNGGVGRNGSGGHRSMVASSQLGIEVSELHAAMKGRLEITCLATIPAHVGPGEQFADYKTHSVKVGIEAAEPTSSLSPMSMAAVETTANSMRGVVRWHPTHTAGIAMAVILAQIYSTWPLYDWHHF